MNFFFRKFGVVYSGALGAISGVIFVSGDRGFAVGLLIMAAWFGCGWLLEILDKDQKKFQLYARIAVFFCAPVIGAFWWALFSGRI